MNGGTYRGAGTNDKTFIIDNRPGNADPNPGDVLFMHVTGYVLSVDDPTDPTITMLCYVGVDDCSELSTALTQANVITNSGITTIQAAATQTTSNGGIYLPITTTYAGMAPGI